MVCLIHDEEQASRLRCEGLWAFLPLSHLNLALAHNLVHDLVVVLADLALVVARLVAQDPEALGALQLDLKLLQGDRTYVEELEEREDEATWAPVCRKRPRLFP